MLFFKFNIDSGRAIWSLTGGLNSLCWPCLMHSPKQKGKGIQYDFFSLYIGARDTKISRGNSLPKSETVAC